MSTDKASPAAIKPEALPKPRGWHLFVLVASVAYLVLEFVFNAQLVSTAGLAMQNHDTLRQVELFGRAIAGFGASLLVADLIIPRSFRFGFWPAATALTMVTWLVWPSVYFGQKALIESLLVDESTPEQRQRAVFAQTLKGALASSTIEIQGLPFKADAAHGPAEKTFLALFGAIVYADDTVVKAIEEHKRTVARNLAEDYAMADFDLHYARYQRLRAEVRERYQEYREHSQRYNDERAKTPGRVQGYWRDVEQEVADGWEKYQKQVSAFEARMQARAQKVAQVVANYWEKVQECRSPRCEESQLKTYNQEMRQLGMAGVTPESWLEWREVTTGQNVARTLLNGIFTGGVSLVAQALDKVTGGDGGFKDKEAVFHRDVDYYRERLIEMHLDDFKKEARGYEYGIPNLTAFRYHHHTGRLVAAELKKRGVDLPSSWTVRDRAQFDRKATTAVHAEIDRRWRDGVKARGLDMPPNLGWSAFQRHSEIQSRIEHEMGQYYVKPVLADWNDAQFKRNVIDPNVEREVNRAIALIEASPPLFADGGRYEDEGKRAVMATLVPPISMGLSLFLALLTALKLPFLVLRLAPEGIREEQTPGNGDISLFDKHPWRYVRKSWVTMPVFVIALLVAPLFVETSVYARDDNAVSYLVGKVEENASPVSAIALRWVLHTQPVIAPAGDWLEDRIMVFKAFDFVAPWFEFVDRRWNGDWKYE